MLAGIGRHGSNTEPGIIAAPPATINTTMVSPMARDMPRIIPVLTPDREAGMITRIMLSQWVAPNASEASLSSGATLAMASSEIVLMVGTDMKASINDALRRFRPVGISNTS